MYRLNIKETPQINQEVQWTGRGEGSGWESMPLSRWFRAFCARLTPHRTPEDGTAGPRRDGDGITASPQDKHVIYILHAALLSAHLFMPVKELLQIVQCQGQSSVIRRCG